MRVICREQGTPAWNEARRGVISASCADACLAARDTKKRREYVWKIADDLEGIPDFEDEETPPWFLDGRYYESYARGWYSFRKGVDVETTGFVVHDDYNWIGCSPDGVIPSQRGGLEIKYRKRISTFDQHAKIEVLPRPLKAQIQTSLFVTGYDWWDYVNYWRDDDNEVEKGHVQRVWRDQSYIDNTLLPAFLSFWRDVEKEIERRDRQRARAVM